MTSNRLSLLFPALALVLAGCPQATQPQPLPDAPTILEFTAAPVRVALGGKATLSWKTAHASIVDIADVDKGAISGVDGQAEGSVEVTVTADALFVLTAINERGAKATAVASVSVDGASSQVFFSALPAVLAPGQTATLAWSAPGAKSVSITDAAGTAVDLKGQVQTGSVEVSPTAASTTYTLHADSTSRDATVTRAQSVVEFTPSVALATPGQAVTLSWKTAAATKVTLSSPGRGALVTETDLAKVAMGSFADTLPAAPAGAVVPYLLTVEGAGAAVEQSTSVYVGTAPTITEFKGPEYVKQGSSFVLSWKTDGATALQLLVGTQVVYEVADPATFASGSVTLGSPATDTEYTLKATGRGASVTQKLSVKPVGATSVTSFTASTTTVANGGDPVTLTWNVPNARRLRIVANGEHTVVTARGAQAGTGSATVYPNSAMTSYALDADNTLDPAVTQTLTVAVTTPAPFGTAGGGIAFEGSSLDLLWTVGGTSQIYGLPHSNPTVTPTSAGFVDISTTGTKLAFLATADDTTLSFSPKDFETFIYGTRVGSVATVSTNGFLVFGSSSLSRPVNIPIPNATVERNLVAPYWDDLVLGSGAIYWQVLNEAPERVLVVQWDKVQRKGEPTSTLTFEAKVHQTGVVTFEYKTITATTGTPVYGVQGLVEGQVVVPAGAGSSATLFGPRSSPAPLAFKPSVPAAGFIKLSSGYLKVSFTPTQVVRAGDLTITEVMFDPAPAIASTGEWFEVRNQAAFPVDLTGFAIDFGGGLTHTIAAANGTTQVPSDGGYLLLGQSASGAVNDNVATGYVYGTSMTMPQPAGSLSLNRNGYVASASWSAGLGGSGASFTTDVGSTNLLVASGGGLICGSSTPFGTQAPQQRGSPGGNGACLAVTPIPVAYEDISATGAAQGISSFDEAVFSPMLASPFPWFGAAQSQVWISTNGWVAFTAQTSSALTNRVTLSATSKPVGAIAPFWDDLNRNTTLSGQVYLGRVGDHSIVQWHHYTHYAAGDDLNFQVKLFDSGAIEFHYATMTSGSTSSYGNGNGATVWVENPTGTAARYLGLNQPVIAPNTAYRIQ